MAVAFRGLHERGQLFVGLGVGVKGGMGMAKEEHRSVMERVRRGTVKRKDVARRLAELAFGSANDCVRLVMEPEGKLDMDKLDLSLLTEIKRNEKGAVEVRLVDRLKVLQQLEGVIQEAGGMEELVQALKSEEKA